MYISVLVAQDRQLTPAWNNIVALAFILAIDVALITTFGLIGAAVASVIASGITFVNYRSIRGYHPGAPRPAVGAGKIRRRLGVDGWRLHGLDHGRWPHVSNVLRHWTPDVLAGCFRRGDRSIRRPPSTGRSWICPRRFASAWLGCTGGSSPGRTPPARAARDDVLFCPSYSAPVHKRSRTVVTIFEATQKLHLELYPRQTRLINSPLYGWSAPVTPSS